MVATTRNYCSDWEHGQELAMDEAFSKLTLRILTKTLFDLDISESNDVLQRGMATLNRRANPSSGLSLFIPNWFPIPSNRRYNQSMARCQERMDQLIADRREETSTHDDLLSILLDAEDSEGNSLADEAIKDNLLTFLFAGHETSSLALTYTHLLLAQHEEVDRKLAAELETVLEGEIPTLESLNDLEYTEAVIREAMRLYPPAYILFRNATCSTTLDGYDIPEGTIVSIPPMEIQTDARYWEDPDRIKPSRWLDEERDRPEYAYIPFGAGPRSCIGMRFAMLEMKIIVAMLARSFSFSLCSDPDPAFDPGVTLQPADPVRIELQERT